MLLKKLIAAVSVAGTLGAAAPAFADWCPPHAGYAQPVAYGRGYYGRGHGYGYGRGYGWGVRSDYGWRGGRVGEWHARGGWGAHRGRRW